MSKVITVVFKVLTVKKHNPSINEQDANEYFGRDIPELDYQTVNVEVEVSQPYLDWYLIPNVDDIQDALYAYDIRMKKKFEKSAYLFTAGQLVSVIKVERGKGDWSGEDGDHRTDAKPKELWVMPAGKEYLDLLYGQGGAGVGRDNRTGE